MALILVVTALLTAAAASRGDTIYVSDQSRPNTIYKFTPAGVASVFATNSIDDMQVEGLAFDLMGNLYASYGNTILKFTTNGVGSVFATGVRYPRDLAFDIAGNLFAACLLDNTIMKFTTNGVGSVFATSGLNVPIGLAFDSAGNLFVTCRDYPTASYWIEKFTPDGVGSVFAADPGGGSVLNEPFALAFDNAGNLYAANYNGGSVTKFSPDGSPSVFAYTGESGARDLAFDSEGNLYVIHPNPRIRKFSPTGADLGVFATLPQPQSPQGAAIAIAPGIIRGIITGIVVTKQPQSQVGCPGELRQKYCYPRGGLQRL